MFPPVIPLIDYIPKGLILTPQLELVNRMQYQGTQCHATVTADTLGCSTKVLSVTTLLWAAAPMDSVSSHCYSWYCSLQYEGTLCHHTVVQLVLYNRLQYQGDSVLPHCYSWYSGLQYQGTV